MSELAQQRRMGPDCSLVIGELTDREVRHDKEGEADGDDEADEMRFAFAFEEVADGRTEQVDFDHGGHAGSNFDEGELAVKGEEKRCATGDSREKDQGDGGFEIEHYISGVQESSIMYRG